MRVIVTHNCAVKLAGDINARVADDASLDELLAKIEGELENLKPILGPIIDLEVAREPQGSGTCISAGRIARRRVCGRPPPLARKFVTT